MSENTSENKKFSAIILTAGFSSRMSIGLKALLPLGMHKHMLIRLIDNCLQAGINDIFIVVGHEKERIFKAIANYYDFSANSALNINFTINENYAIGMFSSIQVGFQALLNADKKFDASFLFPVDSALVRFSSINSMQTAYKNSPNNEILIPYFESQSGHPPLIGANHFESIVKYSGENGLRGYFASTQDVLKINAIDEGVLSDIDTEFDYNNALDYLDFTLEQSILSITESFALLKRENVSEKVLKHSVQVGLGAFRLALALNIPEIKAQYSLIAGLLHDLKKVEPKHPKVGEIFLNSLSYKGLACAVATHMDMSKSILEKLDIKHSDLNNFSTLLDESCLDDISCFYACICVYIADRYFAEDKFVSVETRFERVRERFANNPLALEALEERKKIFLRVLKWYNSKTGLRAEDIVNSPSGHIYEEDLVKKTI